MNDANTPVYSGSLTVESGAVLTMAGATGSEYAVNNIAGITMQPLSRIELNVGASTSFPPITLLGNASLATLFGASDWEHSYYDTISGPHTLTLHHFNGHNVHLTQPNSFSALVLDTLDRWRCYAEVAGSLGLGDVIINPRADGRSASLHIEASDAMSTDASLFMNGSPGQGGFTGDGSDYLVMNANLTIGALMVYGVPKPSGTYTNTEPWLSGSGTLTVQAPAIGTNYCGPANVNSSGGPATIEGRGYAHATANDLTLSASGMATNEMGIFLCSETQGFVGGPGGSQGNLCVGGKIGRFASQMQPTGSAGAFSIPVDLTALPVWPNQAVLPGETWNFQAWFTDGSTSNFTDGLTITFQ